MTEDFNLEPAPLEDKQLIMAKLGRNDFALSKIGQIECGNCGEKFVNNGSKTLSQIISHFKDKGHKLININENKINSTKIGVLKCCQCNENNIFKLVISLSEEDEIINDFRNYIYCKNHLPKGYQVLSILDILDLDDIINRKLNKVKLTYETKDEYYTIYKPLVIADMIYTKKVYDTKTEFDIELLVTKSEKYYFIIREDFNEINFSLGTVLHFSENKENNKNDEEEEEEEEEEEFQNIQFLASVVNITPCEDNKEDNVCYYNIWVLPINKHVTSLKGHTGKYKIKEGFCTIPYQRMLEALDLFVNDEEEENNIFDRPISLYLTRRIMGDFPTNAQLNKGKDGTILEKKEDYLRIEKNALNHVLFQENTISKLVKSLGKFGKLNKSQIEALNRVFKNVFNIIQGPPGTGKTFLASFIIYNIFKFKKEKEDKILVCAPSNSATDNLASNLIKLNIITKSNMKILRIYSKSRECVEKDNELDNISLHKLLEEKLNESDDALEPSKEDIEENIQKIVEDADIVITTCSNSWDDRIKSFNFPFVLIDEATQCCEIEALISIVHGCKHLTLIGDQKQLGPVILHPKAIYSGMNISLFERILKLYPDLLNMLNIQYRMHDEIVKFPSMEFYDNKIINGLTLDKRIKKDFNEKFKWPNKDIPLMMVHSDEKEEVIKSGKSKQNDKEANLVMLFVEKLFNCGIDFNNIGVITPYNAQKLLIQKKLKEKYKNLKTTEIKISSVDGFQGREKDFIILSNVRSNKKNQIGFLKDFRRLNVSITRAKYGMIIIGNIECLYNSKSCWRNLIDYYKINNLLYGIEIIEKEEGKNELKILSLNNINLNKDIEGIEYINKEYDFDGSGNNFEINKDLLNNFECTENVYKEGNKKYYKKKKEKRNKKNKKNKNK